MRIRIQLNKICKIPVLPYKELKKTKMIVQNLKNHGACQNLLNFCNEITITTNFLAFFSLFSSTIPPPRIQIRIVNADPEKGRCVTRIGDYMEENVEKTACSDDA